MNEKGYVLSLSSFLLVIPVFLLVMVLINVSISQTSCQESISTSDEVLGVSKDLQTKLPQIGGEVVKDKSQEVIGSGIPLSNSRKEIQDEIQNRMDICCEKYQRSGINAHCDILYVDNSQDPFQMEMKSVINVQKGEIKHKITLNQNISLINGSCNIIDPLPFLRCREFGGVTMGENKILYGSSLTKYLKTRGLNNSQAYENATSPLFIKKCPYHPYEIHGSANKFSNLKNCIDNGFYHESNDGACFFCRLEGRGVCPHYGMETFILPAPSVNITSFNNSSEVAISSVDHVIFNDNSLGTYSGESIAYFHDGVSYHYLFLDNAHRKKYGLPVK